MLNHTSAKAVRQMISLFSNPEREVFHLKSVEKERDR